MRSRKQVPYCLDLKCSKFAESTLNRQVSRNYLRLHTALRTFAIAQCDDISSLVSLIANFILSSFLLH
jgi:hypothetical protein